MHEGKRDSMSKKTQPRNGRSRTQQENRKSNSEPSEPRFGLLVLVGNETQPQMLWDFMSEFGYETVGDESLKRPVDERDLAKTNADLKAFSIVRHGFIDVELLKDEWKSFGRVGTPKSLGYIELLSPPTRKKDGAMELGNVTYFDA